MRSDHGRLIGARLRLTRRDGNHRAHRAAHGANGQARQRDEQVGDEHHAPAALEEVAVAALDLQLRRLGYDMADEFNQRLLAKMQGNDPVI